MKRKHHKCHLSTFGHWCHTESDAHYQAQPHSQQDLHLLGPCAEAKNTNVPVVKALIHMTHIDFPELS